MLLDKYKDTMDWEAFEARCRQHKSEHTVFRYLLLVAQYYAIALPPAITQKYAHTQHKGDKELFLKYLHGYAFEQRQVGSHIQTIRGIGSLSLRLRYLVELIFPSPAFIKKKFGLRTNKKVGFYYVYRWWLGVKGLGRINPAFFLYLCGRNKITK